MQIVFYQSGNRCPVKKFILKLPVKERARVLGSLKNIEELGFLSPRVRFRQIRGRLWEVKIAGTDAGYRIFYVAFTNEVIVLLHAYQKQSQKAPLNEIRVAEQRMKEVLNNEKDYIG